MNARANLETIRDRIVGEPAGRFRAAVMAGTAGIGVAGLVYRLLRNADDDE
jgi:hypothetical protein